MNKLLYILIAVLLGASPRSVVGSPVSTPESYPFAEMNGEGDFLLAGNWRIMVNWNHRYSVLRMEKISEDENHFFSGGISQRTHGKKENGAAIVCSGRHAYLYFPDRSTAFPAGKWQQIYRVADDLVARSFFHGSLRCAMSEEGKWAILDFGRGVLFIGMTAETVQQVAIPRSRLGQNPWLTSFADGFAILGTQVSSGSSLGLVTQDGLLEWDTLLGVYPDVLGFSRIYGRKDFLVYGDSSRLAEFYLQKTRQEPEHSRFFLQRSIPSPSAKEQPPAVHIADDGSYLAAGKWGGVLVTSSFSAPKMVKLPFIGDSGAMAVAHSAKNGVLIVAGRDEGDLGEIALFLTEKNRLNKEPNERSSLWKVGLEPGVRIFEGDSVLAAPPWWAQALGRDNSWRLLEKEGVTPADVTIAAIDSGAPLDHPLIVNSLRQNPDEVAENQLDDEDNGFVDDFTGFDFIKESSKPYDFMGHGSHVSGLLVSGTKEEGSFAIAKNGKLLIVRALDQAGKSNSIDLARAIDYAVSEGAEVMNCSFGGGSPTALLRAAFFRAYKADVLIFASAGNDAMNSDRNGHFPSSEFFASGIGAVTKAGKLAQFSNYGAQSVDFLSPGVEILSTLRDNQMGFMSGTSMASPIAASSAALLLGVVKTQFPQMTRREQNELVLKVMCETARQNRSIQGQSRCGILDVESAVGRLLALSKSR